MREIKLGDKTIEIKATPLTLLYYKQEFKSDLIGDLAKLEKAETDPTKIDMLIILQLVWAMAKTLKGIKFPKFEKWLGEFESIDAQDINMMNEIMQEVAEGFFSKHQKLQMKK